MMLMMFLALQTSTANSFSNVPESVMKTFKVMFPNAESISWEDNEEMFTAYFLEGEIEREALFDSEGKWLETSTVIEEESIPEKITAYVDSKYEVDSYESIIKEESPDKILYFLIFETEDDSYEIVVDENGKPVKE